jgi:hypothetical protein
MPLSTTPPTTAMAMAAIQATTKVFIGVFPQTVFLTSEFETLSEIPKVRDQFVVSFFAFRPTWPNALPSRAPEVTARADHRGSRILPAVAHRTGGRDVVSAELKDACCK